jgi:methionine-rich copper-binding protein CopC
MAIPVAPTNVRASDGLFTNGILIQWNWVGNVANTSFFIFRWRDGEAPEQYDSVYGVLEFLDKSKASGGKIFGAPVDNVVYNYAVKTFGSASSPSPGFSDLSASDRGFWTQAQVSPTDTTPPQVLSVTPSDGATDVVVGSNLTINFSENIARGVGNIEIRVDSANGTVFESFNAATSSRLTVSGSTLTIDPISNLTDGTRYFVVIPSGAIRDSAGNSYAGTSTYDFTTAAAAAAAADDFLNSVETTGIVTIGGVATNGSIETENDRDAFRVILTAGVTYKFNLNVLSGSLTPFLSLFDANGDLIAFNDNFGLSNNSQITFTPTSTGTYYLQARDSATGTGIGRYSLSGNISAVADTTAPTVTTFAPTDGATNVTASSNIVVTFNEAIRVGTGTVEIRSGSATGPVVESFNAATSARLTVSGSALTIDPTSNLAAGTQYFVVLPSGAVRDVAGNAYAGTSTYDFTTAAASAAAATSFRLIAPDGWSGSIGGNGTIFGSAGVQDIRLLSGSIAFDASFNRGGDVVRLAGSANASSASVVGSSAVISTASGVRATVPIGITGLFMSFDDGARKLVADVTGVFRLGTQVVSSVATSISSAAGTDPLPAGTDPAAAARLILFGGALSPGETAHGTFGGRATIFGTTDTEVVAIASGQRINVTFDPSFNRGGDVIILPNQLNTYTAVLVGSSVLLNGADQSLSIPVGANGLTLRFADVDRSLLFTGGAVKIGDQTIGSTAIALSSSVTSVSIDNGSTLATFNAATGAINFTDDATRETNVVITNFASNDRISVSGASATSYSFGTGDNGRDLIISFTNTQTAAVNFIVLDDALVGNSTFVFNYQSAATALGFDFMVFG